MRTLIYVPIMHTSADLGSLAEDVNKRGVAGMGKERWAYHIKTVNGFWDAIDIYLDSIDVAGMKIYQDGMMAEGELGKIIIDEGVKAGSRNHEIVSKLLKKGAILVKTEEFKYVKEEQDMLKAIIKAKSTFQKLIEYLKYKLVKNRMLYKRDKYISKRIDETLGQNETGILFIGAAHNIKKMLPKDLQIREKKDSRKVKKYQNMLLFPNKNKNQYEEFSRYMISKIGE